MKPLIICAAVTGGGAPMGRTPHHPVTPEAIAAECVRCWREGAAMVHFHARGDDGATVVTVAAYRRIIELIRGQGCDAIINISAGDDGGRASHARRLAMADVDVEMVSLDAGSFNAGRRLYDNSPSYVREMAARLQARGITPEIELFDYGHIWGVHDMLGAGLLAAPVYVQFVFGVAGGMPTDPRLLPMLVDQLPPGAEWAVACQASDAQTYLRMTLPAFAAGGHVRCGMEDYVFLHGTEHACSNADQVAQWVTTARLWGRPVASVVEARAMLGMTQAARAAA